MTTEADWKVQAEYPGFWARFYASFLDSVIFLLPISWVGEWFLNLVLGKERFMQRQAFYMEHGQGADSIETFFYAFVTSDLMPAISLEVALTMVLFIVPVIYCWVKYSVTPGKFLGRMRIVDADSGMKMTMKQSVIRYAGYFVSAFFLMLGFIWVAFDKRRQGWHDKMANTVVVYTASLPKKVKQDNA